MHALRTACFSILLLGTSGLFAQSFIPAAADTAELRSLWESNQYRYSKGYYYLKTYYNFKEERDSVQFMYPSDEEPCGFIETFAQGLEYRLQSCDKEGGGTERLRFPKMKLEEAQKFIRLLFYTKDNTWKDDYHYHADGAGCYYDIIQNESFTEIRIWCGC